ncbi:MAG: ABC transporter ATP-binding protein [Porphyromonadaceae bacterium]|nr:ABC transporter ATP-binding protein [Porphyromonadaceae bacterium]
MAFIDVQHVSKHYAAHTALDDVSLSVQAGRVFGLLGPNGAGKTSLIRIINRITAPDSGTILFDGHPLKSEDVARIGYLPEERGLYRKMKVGDQAIYLSRLKGLCKAEAKKRLEQWFEKFDIMPWWDKKVEELSKGMQQKVQFICTVLHEPDLLIFDEPFSGFDPVNAELLKSEILQLRDQGRTIIFSTHNMQSVEEVCDDIALINRSRLVLSGTVEEIRARYASPYVELRVDKGLSTEDLEHISPISSKLHQGQMVLKLMRREGESNRALINRLPEHINILEFHQEIPSMHEIFLNTVQNHD